MSVCCVYSRLLFKIARDILTYLQMKTQNLTNFIETLPYPYYSSCLPARQICRFYRAACNADAVL